MGCQDLQLGLSVHSDGASGAGVRWQAGGPFLPPLSVSISEEIKDPQ